VDRSALIYDWNIQGEINFSSPSEIEFDDETLRDGLQSPSIVDPPNEQKVEILHLMNAIGIHSADLGFPGTGARAIESVTRLAREIVDQKLKIHGSCAARTLESDIIPIHKISEKVGRPLMVDMFIGSSKIRKYVEDWSLEKILDLTAENVRFAVQQELPVMYVTEDTTRAHPEAIRRLYTVAIENGASRICICDTVGHATPLGVWNLIRYVKKVVQDTGTSVKIDFHGHNDRGLSIMNTITALLAGAHRAHGCGLGVGERCGNTPMDLLLINLKLLGWIQSDLIKLSQYSETISKALCFSIPVNYPAFGSDAFRTTTGIHAAAIIKALKKEAGPWLADAVYSGVPAHMIGKKQQIEIGPMSGQANVICWLKEREIPPTQPIVQRIMEQAKKADRPLTEEQIQTLIEDH